MTASAPDSAPPSAEVPAQARQTGSLRWPLYAAGFTTAFGAHAAAANLGTYTQGRGGGLLELAALLAAGAAGSRRCAAAPRPIM